MRSLVISGSFEPTASSVLSPTSTVSVELVRNGAVGKIQTIRVGVPFEPDNEAEYPPDDVMPVPEELDYDLWLGPAPEVPYTEKRVHPRHSFGRPGWMRVRDYCDGMITNWGAHLNDIAQWAHNTERTGPVEIEGKGEYPAKGIWNVLLKFDVRFRFADGVELLYRTERPYIRVEGEKGWIEAEWKDTLAGRAGVSPQAVGSPKSPSGSKRRETRLYRRGQDARPDARGCGGWPSHDFTRLARPNCDRGGRRAEMGS